MAKSGTNLADKLADQVADLQPSRGILWPRVELTWQIRWQIYTLVEASCGQGYLADLQPSRGILWPRVELTWQTRWQIYPP